MEPETQARIFEPFFTTKSRDEGTGLGLSVIHGIIKDHQGKIDVQSQPLQGTIFDVCLPVCEAPPVGETFPAAREEDRGRGEVILLAEDNEYVREIMLTTLENAGYAVVGVADGEEEDFDFTERLEDLNEELEVLNSEARELEAQIASNIATLLDPAP